MNSDWKDTVKEHFQELIARFPSSRLVLSPDCRAVTGQFRFVASYNGKTVDDRYTIRIEIPPGFPNEPPIVKETGRRISNNYHKQNDNVLCLTSPTELLLRYNEARSLCTFAENLLVPYLFRYSVFEKTKQSPWGERSHSGTGLLEGYQELFRTTSPKTAFRFLEHLSRRIINYQWLCPCGNGETLGTCSHGVTLCILRFHRTFQEYREDLKDCLKTVSAVTAWERVPDVYESYLTERETP